MPNLGRHKGNSDPVPGQCRTARVGAVIPGTTRGMFYCRIEDDRCRFALPFGFDFICLHHDNYQFPLAED